MKIEWQSHFITYTAKRKANEIKLGSCDSSYSWRETSNEIDEFLKPYLAGEEMPW